MNILITGGAGFIGSHVVDCCLEYGHNVRVLDDFSTGLRQNIEHVIDRIELIEGDICQRSVVCEAMHGIDRVCHLAALVSVPKSIKSPELSFHVNAYGTQVVLDESRKAGVSRVVLASSAAIYGDNDRLPLQEEETARPLSPYGLDKLYGEQLGALYTRLYGIPVTALRFFNVFGPRQDPTSPYSGVISIFIRNMLASKDVLVYGDGQQTRDFIYVRDLTKAIHCALIDDRPVYRAYNVGSGEKTSLNDLYRTLGDIIDFSTSVSSYLPAREGDILHSLASIDAIKLDLSFRPSCSLFQGLQETVEWMSEFNH